MMRMLADGMDDIDARATTKSFEYRHSFKFDPNDYRTFKESAKQLEEILPFVINGIATGSYLQDAGADEFGVLCANVAAYLLHIRGDATTALPLLNIALGRHCDLGWALNNTAFAFQQQMVAAKKVGNKDLVELNYKTAIAYCDQAASDTHFHLYSDIDQIKIVAFSLCVRALAIYEMGDLQTAITTYRKALDLYEEHKLIDDQYSRAKNRWAMMLVENNEIEKASVAFSQLRLYWKDVPKDSPYPVRFLSVYAEFLEKRNIALEAKVAGLEQQQSRYPSTMFPTKSKGGEDDVVVVQIAPVVKGPGL